MTKNAVRIVAAGVIVGGVIVAIQLSNSSRPEPAEGADAEWIRRKYSANVTYGSASARASGAPAPSGDAQPSNERRP